MVTVTLPELSVRTVRFMSGVDPDGQATPAVPGTARRIHLSSATALIVGGLVPVLIIADVPLALFAHQSLNSSGGSSPVWFAAALGVVGFVS